MIELLTVVGIIGILATIGIPQYLKARTKSQWDGDCKTNLRAVAASAELYKNTASLTRSYDWNGNCNSMWTAKPTPHAIWILMRQPKQHAAMRHTKAQISNISKSRQLV